MAGYINSPLDRPQVPPPDASLPIIPQLTQLAPGMMRAVMRSQGMQNDEESDDNLETATPPDLVNLAGKVFVKAQETPGLIDAIISMGRTIKIAMTQLPQLQMQNAMPQPISQVSPPPSMDQVDMLSTPPPGYPPQPQSMGMMG